MKTLKFLQESQYWDEDRIKTYQLKKIKKLVSHSYTNIPYYKKLFTDNHIHPQDIQSFEDFKKIPVLTKDMARAENQNLTVANVDDTKNVIKGLTGGTTGLSLNIYKDHHTRSFVWSAFYRWYDWMGINLGDPLLFIKGGIDTHSAENFINRLKDYFQNTVTLNFFDITNERLEKITEGIILQQPVFLRGYVSTLILLAEYIQRNKIKLPLLKAISTTAEVLLPSYRAVLEKAFGCKIYDQYGCGECESIAFECSQHNGLHITMEHVYLEIHDENGNDTAGEGKLIVTDLDNYAMPFIRYENGDMAKFSDISCSCGVKHPLMESISGRIADCIVLKNGTKVFGQYFTMLLLDNLDPETYAKVNKFQAFQEKAGQIEFRLESKSDINQSILSKLTDILSGDFSPAKVIVMEKIPLEKSGKFRFLKSTVNNHL